MKFKKKSIYLEENFNFINVVAVTFDQFNVSLLNKSIQIIIIHLFLF